jgi:hypothetical protein
MSLGRDREIAHLGEAPADVLDMLMDAEDLLDHVRDHRRLRAGQVTLWPNYPPPKPTPKLGSVSVNVIRLAIRKAMAPRPMPEWHGFCSPLSRPRLTPPTARSP